MPKFCKNVSLVTGLTVLTLIFGFMPQAFAETDVTSKVELVQSRLMFDRNTSTSYLDVVVKNISTDVLLTPIKVVIDTISPADVIVANADGTISGGKPYFEYTIGTGKLMAGTSTATKRISFNNPKRLRFSYTTKVYAVDCDQDGDGENAILCDGSDCNDNDATIHSGAAEVCGDGVDQDCSGTDLTCPQDIDDDSDGYTENQGDCNDNDATIHPGAVEVCGDGVDQDCSGGDLICPQDIDDDSDGYTENQGDCNDSDAMIHPGAVEVCGDGVDQDCSGGDLICPQDIDDDLDGYTENQGDCNDSDATIHPGAVEVCGDGVDQDCSGGDLICPQDIDDDLDGYTENQGDCNDSDATIHPGAVEVCGDGVDQDCSGGDLICPQDIDDDLDGYTENQGDCNDSDATIHPGAVEVCGDGVDQDCSGGDLICPENIDDDLDGVTENQGDCNDSDATIHPGAVEVCGDGIDQDCSGGDLTCPEDIDDDLDGYTENQGDCNDSDATIHPGTVEVCGDGIDQDCDGSDLTCKVPDTGQITSYTDIWGEDSDYTINPPAYTKLDANGADLPDSATEWAMIRDNVTGLIWENKTDDGGIHDKDNTYTWYDPNPATNGGNAGTPGNGTDTQDFIDALNLQKFGGFQDWRLPTVKELSWIVNSDIPYPGPTINTAYFQNTINYYYWSSTTNDNTTGNAWGVNFYYGYVSSHGKSYSFYVRAVRGGE